MRKLPETLVVSFDELAANAGIRYDQASKFLDVLEQEWNKPKEPLVCAGKLVPPPPPVPNSLSVLERRALGEKRGRPFVAKEAFLKAGDALLKSCANIEVLPRKYLCKMAGFSTPSFYRYFDSMETFWNEVRSRQKQDN